MAVISLSHRTIPNELLSRIILRVIANSVHAICIYPGDVEWEMNVLPTLCRVSYNFRAVTLELTRRAFQVSPAEDISSIFPPIAKQLQRLRLFGLRLHRPSRYTSYFEPLADDSLLIYGYSLFLSAMDLRYNSVSCQPTVFQTTQEIIINALSMSLVMCPKVEPPGMAQVLSDAMCKQMVLVRSGLDIVQASVRLDHLIELRESLDNSEEEDVEQKRFETRNHIVDEIEKIEVADKIYAEVIESDQIFMPAELPGVIPVIKKLRQVVVKDHGQKIAKRLDSLLEKWSMSFHS
ncbi:hypothetical protein FPV67DRAFT_1451238 [Lyophyllum atratum]|nr:hypothetical protein FPV67DRAFT_1451238 [Lyophyllum atratum]